MMTRRAVITAAVWTIGAALAVVISPGLHGPITAQAPPAAPAAATTLVGHYRCEGVNPDGSRYQGTAEILAVGGTYRVRWEIGDDTIWGVGILSGRVFAVSYVAGGAPAIVIYTIEDGRLAGVWTMGGAEGRTYGDDLVRTTGPPAVQPPAGGARI